MRKENNMIRVVFYHQNGDRREVRGQINSTVMDCALDNNIVGILAQCGGGCTCSTCHCYIREPWLTRLPDASNDEQELLSHLNERQGNSRLTCQIFLNKEIDGIEIDIPMSDNNV